MSGFHVPVTDKSRIFSNIGIRRSTQSPESHCDCIGLWQ